MPMDFVIPSRLEDLASTCEDDSEIRDDDNLRVKEMVDIENLSDSDSKDLVDKTVFDLCENDVLCIAEQEVFDQVYWLTRRFPNLRGLEKSRLVDGLCSNLSVLTTSLAGLMRSAQRDADPAAANASIVSHRTALKVYVFFLRHLTEAAQNEQAESEEQEAATASVAPTGKGRAKRPKASASGGGWDWAKHRERVAEKLASALECDLWALYRMQAPEEAFLQLFIKSALLLLESPSAAKSPPLCGRLASILSLCACRYKQLDPVVSSLVHLLHAREHAAPLLADVAAHAATSLSDASLASGLLREVGRTDPREYTRDPNGCRNVGAFIGELAEKLPRLVANNLSVLLPHLQGGEAYALRSAIVGVVGQLLCTVFSDAGAGTNANNSNNGGSNDAGSGSGSGSAGAGNGPTDGPEATNANSIARLRNKQALLDLLMERARDVNAYTRTKVLQTWASLAERRAIPLGSWNAVASLACGRLEDKSAFVRRAALQLLAEMVQFNPFGPMLASAAYQVSLRQFQEKLAAMEPPAASTAEDGEDGAADAAAITANAGGDDSGDHGHDEDDYGGPQGAQGEHGGQGEPDKSGAVDGEASAPGENGETSSPSRGKAREAVRTGVTPPSFSAEEVEATRVLVASLQSALSFAKLLQGAMPLLVQLLASSTNSDVVAAIQFLVLAQQFQIDDARAAVRKMLPLVFSGEASIRETVVDACVLLYLKGHAADTAWRLIDLSLGATLGELTSMEAVLCEMVKSSHLKSATVRVLWDIFAGRVASPTAGATSAQAQAHRRAALLVLSMAAGADASIITQQLPTLLEHGFGPSASTDVLMARTACAALQRVAVPPPSSISDNPSAAANRKSLGGANARKSMGANANSRQSMGGGGGSNPWGDLAGGAGNAGVRVDPRVFLALTRIVMDKRGCLPDESWFSAAQQAIDALYHLHTHPDAVCKRMLELLAKRTFLTGKGTATPIPAATAATAGNNDGTAATSAGVADGTPTPAAGDDVAAAGSVAASATANATATAGDHPLAPELQGDLLDQDDVVTGDGSVTAEPAQGAPSAEDQNTCPGAGDKNNNNVDGLGVSTTLPPPAEPSSSASLSGLRSNGLDYGRAVSSSALARFLFVVGHVALRHLVYVEECARRVRACQLAREKAAASSAASEQERQREREEEAGHSEEDEEEGNAPKATPAKKRGKKGGAAVPDEAAAASAKEPDLAAQLGVGAGAKDAELDALKEEAERQILSADAEGHRDMVALFAPIVQRLCWTPAIMDKDPVLRASAMLALCKLMAVDAHFCEANLQLLFTLLQNAPEKALRSNSIVALGDLAFRFPNLLEPWTRHMYSRLRDPSPQVRKTCLMVLTHLILNDMMKVKGYISEMALCIEDEEPRIASLAKLFFHELAQRSNSPIYNLLPDMISRLSASSSCTESMFQNIMDFLIGFIKKEKQNESLIEKLCLRFPLSTDGDPL
eukprot:jgi/Mesvir1/6000/Mv00748-RA.2